ncbi:hypothetical protein ATO6_00560 [Oceanicola sp. 22II-s10i]|uniref:hypothetical protein n=1 Tax=Oceanicola sp. 22II-s10i TaxID=1317116 RepID=UPI000B52756D|nr:hypothetical protein [Oceanicola sp. 22II-s10i]OWU85480.1 hypothetical protein ATO6_00560 [Oceanicola sp. 22II-s10i]
MTDLSALQARAARVNAIYRDSFGIADDPAFYIGKIAEEAGEAVGAHLRLHGLSRGGDGDARQALEDELADLFGFLLVYCDRFGVDLDTAFERKWGRYLEPRDDA